MTLLVNGRLRGLAWVVLRSKSPDRGFCSFTAWQNAMAAGSVDGDTRVAAPEGAPSAC